MLNRTRRGTVQRTGTRTLGAAEGVLVALCGCSLDDAFLELIAAAKNHNVDAMTLAATIVALAEDPSGYECDEAAVRAATIAWEPLVRGRIVASGSDSDDPASLLER